MSVPKKVFTVSQIRKPGRQWRGNSSRRACPPARLPGQDRAVLAAGQRAVIAQAGYTGQNHFSVTYGDQKVTVRAEDGYAALFTAAKHWGYKFTRPEYHQNARATKLHYTPDTRPGALI